MDPKSLRFTGRARYVCVNCLDGRGQRQFRLPEADLEIIREADGSLTLRAQALLIVFAAGQWASYETWVTE